MSVARVGFIGLGNMGQRMATRLVAAGFALSVYDVRGDAIAPVVSLGASAASSPAALAARCNVICLCLPGPDDVERCIAGPDGVLEGASAGSIVVDHTTNSPAVVRDLHSQLAQRKVGMLDAPVSGGITGAEAGKLTMQVGGDLETLECCRTVLQAMASTILHVGGIGAGCICKLAHNCAVFSANLAMMECMTAAIRSGVDANVIVDVFQKSGIGRNHDLQVSLPVTLFRGAFDPPRFTLRTAVKDMALALDMAKSVSVPTDMADACEKDMRAAMERGWADLDHAIYLTLQEERAGVQVRVP